MSDNTVLLTIDEHHATLTLNRPERHNAFDDAMLAALLKALQTIKANEAIRFVILRANGTSFSAGADLAWMQRMSDYSYSQNIADAELLANVMDSLANLPQPTLAIVQGAAFGGGVGLIACCDIVLASTQAEFCLSEVKLGLIPAVISPYLIRAMGFKTTTRYALTAERFNAAIALQTGLVSEVLEPEHLEARATTLQAHLLKNAPSALRECKKLLNQLLEPEPFTHIKALSVETIARLRVSPEGQMGLKAFLNKQTPTWHLVENGKDHS